MANPSAPAGQSGNPLWQEWLKKWLEKNKENVGKGTITDALWKDLEPTYDAFVKEVKEAQQSFEMDKLCESTGHLTNGAVYVDGVKTLCQGILKIRYFMSGVKTERWGLLRGVRTDHPAKIEKHMSADEIFKRCIVGMVGLWDIYGEHCKLGDVIQKVREDVDTKLSVHLTSRHLENLNMCKSITAEGLTLGRTVLGDRIKNWVKEDKGRAERKKGDIYSRWVGGAMYVGEGMCPGGEDEKKKARKDNMEVMAKFLSLSGANAHGGNNSQPSVLDVLMNDNIRIPDITLENALLGVVKKDSTAGGVTVDTEELTKAITKLQTASEKALKGGQCKDIDGLCDRAQCAMKQWFPDRGKKEEQQADRKEMWNEVKTEVTSLYNALPDNGGSDGDADDLCKGIICPNENANCVSKTTCNIMIKALKEVYKVGDDDTASGPRKLNDRIFKSTMRCVILNAFAEKLKQHAQGGGYACAVEDGIIKAFAAAQENKKYEKWCEEKVKGDGSCQPCGKEHQVCTGSKIRNELLLDSVKEELNKDSNTKVKSTFEEINKKATLCDRLHCAINHWKTAKGTPQTQINDEEFWTGNDSPVKTLWDELAEKMKATNGTGNGECGSFETEAEKWACKYLHAGFEELYKKPEASAAATTPTASSSVLDNPSFRQTMGCFLLHSYAKHMKEKAVCDIEEGIKKAFATAGKGIGTACTGGNGQCIPCKWEQEKYESCEISTNGQSGTNDKVEDKLNTIINKDTDQALKEGTEAVNKLNLCQRFECVSNRWIKQNNGSRSWKDVWEQVKTELTQLVAATSEDKRKVLVNYCDLGNHTDGRPRDKEACLLIAAGLKNLYNITNGTGTDGAVEASFQRTMHCVLLNAIADKMESKELTCKEERSVTEGINKAFGNSGQIKGDNKCNDDKCFTCERYTQLSSCNVNSNNDQVKAKVDDFLEKDTTLQKDALITTICKPCDQVKLCERLDCISKKYGQIRGRANGERWDTIIKGYDWLFNGFVGHMGKMMNNDEVTTHCEKDKDSKKWGTDAHGEANKKACLLTAAGLHRISSILETYSLGNNGTVKNENPFDHQDTKQFVSCLMLNALIRKMKKESPICDIDEGIKKAFDSAEQIKNQHCINGKPCFVCKLDVYDKIKDCPNGNGNDKVKEKMDSLLTDKAAEVNKTLKDITDTDGNKGPLCKRLQCLSSKVQALTTSTEPLKSSANDFWKKGGEVEKLWTELSTAMKTNGDKDNGTVCGQMEDGSATNGGTASRQATDPERKACQHLTAGFNKLKDSSTNIDSTYPILSTNPLLRQTVGCFLLKEYAKQLQKDSTCVITSGLEKAFKEWNEKINKSNDPCPNGSPCIDCKWEDNIDNCNVPVDKTGTETAKNKVDALLKQKENEMKSTMDKINETKSLCDQLKCAAPKWFQNEMNGTGGPNSGSGAASTSSGTKKTWCDFWGDDGVRTTLQTMFEKISSEGQNKPTLITIDGICQGFGDGNERSVERKACNHIVAGLKYIDGIKPNGTGGEDKQLLDRAVACIALNLYADQIIAKSNDKCPIDEKIVQKMFNDWNVIKRASSSCNGVSNKDCFECKRVPTSDFKDCKLSVAETLIKTTSPPNGDCKTNATEVKTKMEGLLLKDDAVKMEPTLKEINKMDSFCSRMQCAAKQYYAKKNGGQSTGVKWSEIKGVVDDELKNLLQNITNDKNWEQTTFDQYCKENIGSSWSTDTEGEKKAKQKACKLFASGLNHISDIKNDSNNKIDEVPLKQTMMCAALNLYADQLTKNAKDQCPLDNKKLNDAIQHAFDKNNAIMNGGSQCSTGTNAANSCFVCKRHDSFPDCKIGHDKIGDKMTNLLLEQDNSNTASNNNQEKTLEKINKIETFCTQNALSGEIARELKELLEYMTEGQSQQELLKYCDNDANWKNLGHKQSKTNKAACLLFAAGLQHIYTHGNGRVNGPSFEQTMGCLFLKEYAKQLQTMANKKKQGNSWVHPKCDIDKGIEHAFNQSNAIMSATSPCNKNGSTNSCFVCIQNEGYETCRIGTDSVKGNVEPLLQSEQTHMQQTLENTVCPILITDLLTPFLPLAPVSIGLSAMAYYLWKYFGPLGKGGPRFRRSPAEIRGPSVQEQLLDHVQQDSSHEYRLVKERKPRSVPTRTKRSGRVNRRTIIEIHFEVLDECQKGDSQLAQNDFLELLVQEFMGSELMEEEQVSKEEVLMEGVPLERVPIERVPILGSVFMV
ncbi:SICAvar type I [Plasmodium knowlesi]|uniref:SICAvar type I n=1 Tax=Plasmodium knowlesi TaxID=5850 RepID=A0A1Y3DTG2_PLAKN|nr:SICAvar type I [Plasmodium knowlesi]